MRVPTTAILLTVLMASSSNLSVKAQVMSDAETERVMSLEYGERLERLMGMDIGTFLEINRVIKHPTKEESVPISSEQNEINFRNLFIPDYIAKHKVAHSIRDRVVQKYGEIMGELQGSFRLKDGNTAYYFLLKKWKSIGGGYKPGVPNAVDITGMPVKSVSSYGRNTLSPDAVRTVAGYEIQPQDDSAPKVSGKRYYTCETYIVVNPAGKLFFWSHKGDWVKCHDGHRNSTK
jgi:hypothetical protein